VSLCIAAAGKITVMAVAAFTLSWTHSVEKTRWQESWRLTPAGLQVVEARVQGSGAGMDPPDGSIFQNGWWVYRPKVAPQQRLVLAASGATVGGWLICGGDQCATFGQVAADPIVLSACDPDSPGK
jgi:hypothetical protein